MLRPLVAVLLTVCLVSFPALAAKKPKPEPDGDVLADVLRMLGEGVASNVIVDWLDKGDKSVRALEPDDLIALSKAGATDALVQTLLERAAASRSGATPAPSAGTAPAVPRPDPPGAPNDGKAGLAIALHYRSQSDSGDERRSRWAMFAYLDGKPVVWATSGSEPFRASLRIAPGEHVLRLTRESHLERKKGWRHDTIAALEPIEFTIEPGEGWQLSIDWLVKTFRFSDKGPLSWSLTHWGSAVAAGGPMGTTNLDDWPRLCDDIEANAPPGKMPNWVQRELRGCVRWNELWEGVPGVPDRTDLLTELAKTEFRPPPI